LESAISAPEDLLIKGRLPPLSWRERKHQREDTDANGDSVYINGKGAREAAWFKGCSMAAVATLQSSPISGFNLNNLL
jgi:hypothetical protein